MVGRFHPATRRLKEIVGSGELGIITKIEANLILPSGLIKDNDIRMVYDLGGGSMMDLGCEFYIRSPPTSYDFIISHRLHFVRVAVPFRRQSHEDYQCQVRRTSKFSSD